MYISPLSLTTANIKPNNIKRNESQFGRHFSGLTIKMPQLPDDKIDEKVKIKNRAKNVLNRAKINFGVAVGTLEHDCCDGFNSKYEDGKPTKVYFPKRNSDNNKILQIYNSSSIKSVLFDPEELTIFDIEEKGTKTGRKNKYFYDLSESPTVIFVGIGKKLFSGKKTAKEVFQFEDGKLTDYYKNVELGNDDFSIENAKKHVQFT